MSASNKCVRKRNYIKMSSSESTGGLSKGIFCEIFRISGQVFNWRHLLWGRSVYQGIVDENFFLLESVNDA